MKPQIRSLVSKLHSEIYWKKSIVIFLWPAVRDTLIVKSCSLYYIMWININFHHYMLYNERIVVYIIIPHNLHFASRSYVQKIITQESGDSTNTSMQYNLRRCSMLDACSHWHIYIMAAFNRIQQFCNHFLIFCWDSIPWSKNIIQSARRKLPTVAK